MGRGFRPAQAAEKAPPRQNTWLLGNVVRRKPLAPPTDVGDPSEFIVSTLLASLSGLALATLLAVWLLRSWQKRRRSNKATASPVDRGASAMSGAKAFWAGSRGGSEPPPAVTRSRSQGESLKMREYVKAEGSDSYADFLHSHTDSASELIGDLEAFCFRYLSEYSLAREGSGSAAFLVEQQWPDDQQFRLHGHCHVFVDGTARFNPELLIGSDHLSNSEAGSAEDDETRAAPKVTGLGLRRHGLRPHGPAGIPGLHIDRRVQVRGGTFDLRGGSIFVSPGAIIEAGTVLKGPVCIGPRSTVRSGAYVQGPVLIGGDVDFRGETRDAILMEGVRAPHSCFVLGSVVGRHACIGYNAVIAAHESAPNVVGDYATIGHSVVLQGGCFVESGTAIDSTAALGAGVYSAESN